MKINIASTKEVEISDELLHRIKEKLKSMPDPTYYWDYRDELFDEQIAKILTEKDGINEVESDIWEQCVDNMYDIEQAHIIDCLEWFKSELEEELDEEDIDIEKIAGELREELLDYVSIDMDFKQLLSNTGSVNCRVQLYSNYDCINSNWYVTSGGGYTYEESYFGDMVNALNLNPAKVKKAFEERDIPCVGKWPNKKHRDGKEYVDYKALAIEMENNTCTGLFTILCKVDLNDILEHGGLPTKFIVPKGNGCGIFSDFQGGGSMLETPLLCDMEIDTTKGKTKYDCFKLIPDLRGTGNGYTVDEVYGTTSEAFGSEISIIK